MSARTGLAVTALGALATAVVTSLPELVTSVAAVRRGALALAVGGIIGGNAYDVLFLCFSDLAFRDGSIYAAFTAQHVFLLAIAIVMSAVLLLGLIKRPRGTCQYRVRKHHRLGSLCADGRRARQRMNCQTTKAAIPIAVTMTAVRRCCFSWLVTLRPNS